MTSLTAARPSIKDICGIRVEIDTVADLLRGLPADLRFAVDAGAHRGIFSRAVLDMGLSVLAVEANPQIADQFATNLSADLATGRLVLERCAVSDHTGEADFILGSASTVSTLEPDWARTGFPEEFLHPRQIRVPLRRIDDLCQTNGFNNLGLLKVDVEGHELQALQGFFDRGRLAAPAVVMFEAFSKFPAAAERCIAYLADQGYDIFDLFVRVGPDTVDLERFSGRTLPNAWQRHDGSNFYANVLAYHPSVIKPSMLPEHNQMREVLNLPTPSVR